jgi:hypothetical protein
VLLHRRVSAHRQEFAATYVLPADLAASIRHRYDDPRDAGPVLHGLRQWLRLRILTDEPMGMPSLGVQAALDRWAASRTARQAFRKGACGSLRTDRLTETLAPDVADGESMALTWAMACNDEQKRPDSPGELPRLFAADAAIRDGKVWRWVMFCGHEPCCEPGHCVHHDLLPHLPADIPHQVHFGLPAPHRPVDMHDQSRTTGDYLPF